MKPYPVSRDHLIGMAWAFFESGPDASTVQEVTDAVEAVLHPIERAILIGTPEGMVQVTAMHHWARDGFPVIQMPHTYTAALLVTRASEDVVEQVRPPFDSFLIEVPDGLIFLEDKPNHSLAAVAYLLVYKLENPKVHEGWSWGYHAYSRSGFNLFRYGVRAAELLPPDIPDVLPGVVDRPRNDDRGPFSYDLTDQDKRAMALIGRLIVNVCLAFSNPENVKARPTPTRHRITAKLSGRPSVPAARTFVLGKPVVHDFRAHVRAYSEGASRAPVSVRIVVAGHWKHQPYGPGLSLRKVIWVEPYWRGPEDAPIAIRPHVIERET